MVHTISYEEKPRVVGGPMTYEEFLQWEGDPHVEWVNGYVTRIAPISGEHDELHSFLIMILRARRNRVRDGILRHDPFQLKLPAGGPGRAPDVQYILNAHAERVKPTYTDGPADLVIEIISPSTRGTDRGDKFVEYEQGGVPEYWLLDLIRNRHEFYQLGENGIYELATIPPDGVYRSRAVPGLWIRLDWLNQDSLPDVVDVLKEWGLV
jgi:Uma2 family endonuclease